MAKNAQFATSISVDGGFTLNVAVWGDTASAVGEPDGNPAGVNLTPVLGEPQQSELLIGAVDLISDTISRIIGRFIIRGSGEPCSYLLQLFNGDTMLAESGLFDFTPEGDYYDLTFDNDGIGFDMTGTPQENPTPRIGIKFFGSSGGDTTVYVDAIELKSYSRPTLVKRCLNGDNTKLRLECSDEFNELLQESLRLSDNPGHLGERQSGINQVEANIFEFSIDSLPAAGVAITIEGDNGAFSAAESSLGSLEFFNLSVDNTPLTFTAAVEPSGASVRLTPSVPVDDLINLGDLAVKVNGSLDSAFHNWERDGDDILLNWASSVVHVGTGDTVTVSMDVDRVLRKSATGRGNGLVTDQAVTNGSEQPRPSPASATATGPQEVTLSFPVAASLSEDFHEGSITLNFPGGSNGNPSVSGAGTATWVLQFDEIDPLTPGDPLTLDILEASIVSDVSLLVNNEVNGLVVSNPGDEVGGGDDDPTTQEEMLLLLS